MTTFAGTSQRRSKPIDVCHYNPRFVQFATYRGAVAPNRVGRQQSYREPRPASPPSSTRVRNTRCGVRIHKTIERVTHLIRLATFSSGRENRRRGTAPSTARRLACRTTDGACRLPVSAVPRLPIVVGRVRENDPSTTYVVSCIASLLYHVYKFGKLATVPNSTHLHKFADSRRPETRQTSRNSP